MSINNFISLIHFPQDILQKQNYPTFLSNFSTDFLIRLTIKLIASQTSLILKDFSSSSKQILTPSKLAKESLISETTYSNSCRGLLSLDIFYSFLIVLKKINTPIKFGFTLFIILLFSCHPKHRYVILNLFQDPSFYFYRS